MTISKEDWQDYIGRLRNINKTAAEKMQAYIEANGIDNLEAATQYAYKLSSTFGAQAAEVAAEMYNATAAAEAVYVAPAVLAAPPTYAEVASPMFNVTNFSQNPPTIASEVGRLVKRTAADTTLKNALRDGAQFAWIPSGDTCAFCMTLAANGWQNASKKAIKNGHAEHIHPNCDCNYCVRFDNSTNVAGYDPSEYLEKYYEADGNTSKQRINAMRREQYAENKDKINAQKRAAYAARKERESEGQPDTEN